MRSIVLLFGKRTESSVGKRVIFFQTCLQYQVKLCESFGTQLNKMMEENVMYAPVCGSCRRYTIISSSSVLKNDIDEECKVFKSEQLSTLIYCTYCTVYTASVAVCTQLM